MLGRCEGKAVPGDEGALKIAATLEGLLAGMEEGMGSERMMELWTMFWGWDVVGKGGVGDDVKISLPDVVAPEDVLAAGVGFKFLAMEEAAVGIDDRGMTGPGLEEGDLGPVALDGVPVPLLLWDGALVHVELDDPLPREARWSGRRRR